jgi:hypothetical protein
MGQPGDMLGRDKASQQALVVIAVQLTAPLIKFRYQLDAG